MKIKFVFWISLIFVGFVFVPSALAQQGQGVVASQIDFPIAELGNCSSVGACKVFCDKPANISACVIYAEKNGMITAEEANRAKQFSDVLLGEGPGGCKDKSSCELYCSDVSHIDECLVFGEKHNLISEKELGQAKKVATALKAGANLPGGCTDRVSCEKFCSDIKNVNACLNFAEQAGFLTGEELEQAKKVAPFLEKGETPGGCKTKDACETYCEKDSNFSECVGFAEKVGFISKEEADIAKKAGGKGPGGCKGEAACAEYCNKPENTEACFRFAEEKGIIPAEKLKEIKDGMGRLRSGMDQMPEELLTCVKEKLGEDAVNKIQAGTYTPGPAVGGLIQSCVSDYMPKIREKLNQAMEIATPEVKKCLSEKVGDDNIEKLKNGEAPNPAMADKMKSCFESMKTEGLTRLREGLSKMPAAAVACLENKLGKDVISRVRAGENVELDPNVGGVIQSCLSSTKEEMFKQFEDKLQSAPPEIKSCIESKMEALAKEAESGVSPDVNSVINECMKSFKPSIPEIPSAGYVPQGMQSSGGEGSVPSTGFTPPTLPPGSEDCLKQVYGEDMASKIMKGETQPPADIGTKLQQCMMSRFGAPR